MLDAGGGTAVAGAAGPPSHSCRGPSSGAHHPLHHARGQLAFNLKGYLCKVKKKQKNICIAANINTSPDLAPDFFVTMIRIPIAYNAQCNKVAWTFRILTKLHAHIAQND